MPKLKLINVENSWYNFINFAIKKKILSKNFDKYEKLNNDF